MFGNIILSNIFDLIKPEVALLPPLSTPGVLDDPVILPTDLILPVAHQQDGVVSELQESAGDLQVWFSEKIILPRKGQMNLRPVLT